jgi:hypothetical protein
LRRGPCERKKPELSRKRGNICGQAEGDQKIDLLLRFPRFFSRLAPCPLPPRTSLSQTPSSRVGSTSYRARPNKSSTHTTQRGAHQLSLCARVARKTDTLRQHDLRPFKAVRPKSQPCLTAASMALSLGCHRLPRPLGRMVPSRRATTTAMRILMLAYRITSANVPYLSRKFFFLLLSFISRCLASRLSPLLTSCLSVSITRFAPHPSSQASSHAPVCLLVNPTLRDSLFSETKLHAIDDAIDIY